MTREEAPHGSREWLAQRFEEELARYAKGVREYDSNSVDDASDAITALVRLNREMLLAALRAEPSEQEVERMAEWLYNFRGLREWANEGGYLKEQYRISARAALSAARSRP
jgi:hypothetical protein